MSKVASRIIRRGGVYQFRRRVPGDVRERGAFGGKEIIQISLRTSDLVAARREAAKLDEWFEGECASARGVEPAPARTGPAGGMVLSDAYLKAIQDRYVAVALADDVQERLAAQADPNLHELIEERDLWMAPTYSADAAGNIIDKEGSDASRREWLIRQFRRDVEPFARHHAKAFDVSPGSREYSLIESVFVEAELKILAERQARRPGEVFGEGYRPANLAEPRVKPESAWTMRKLAQRYLDVTPSGASWQHKVDIAIDLFEEFLGRPTPIAQITRDHVREFLELLAVSPQRSKLRFPKLGLREAVEANRLRKPRPYPAIGSNTIRDNHFAVLRVLFGYACGDLGAIPYDPTERVKVKGATKKGGRSAHFELDELVQLFRLPVYTGHRSASRLFEPGNEKLDNHEFWTPLIMLFTGARPSEIAQLAVTDVKLKSETPSISILTEYDPHDPGDRPYVLAFKTENARRNVPLHPALIKLGFAEFVERTRKAGHERLFPEWKAASDPRKLYSGATWVRRFNEKTVPLVTNKKPKPTIYSLRHTFKTQMAICRVPPQFQDQIMGHAGPRMDPTYLKAIPIRELYAEAAKVEYPGLDLDHLRR
jgi:integrase